MREGPRFASNWSGIVSAASHHILRALPALPLYKMPATARDPSGAVLSACRSPRYDAGRSHRLIGVTFLIRESWPDRRRLKTQEPSATALRFWISNNSNNTTDVRSKPLPFEVTSCRLIPRTRLKWEMCFGHQPCWE
jgi:hypothetical protein